MTIRIFLSFGIMMMSSSYCMGVLPSVDSNAFLNGMIELPQIPQKTLQSTALNGAIPKVLPNRPKVAMAAKALDIPNLGARALDIASVVRKASRKIAERISVDNALRDSATSDNNTTGFGPHLITGSRALELANFAEFALETAVDAKQSFRVQGQQQVRQALSRVGTSFLKPARRRCPFSTTSCDRNSKYRTIDGSCNNIRNPLWGMAATPFERILPPAYDDDVRQPRKRGFNGGILPLARNISVNIHDNLPKKANDLSHFSMEFGQMISHDIQRNALAKGYLGGNLDCCRHKNQRNCFHIPIPANDEHFSKFGVRCMNFVRALPAPSLDCSLGVRQQLNQNTHFLDGSVIYGSDETTMNSLRDGAFLRSTGNNDLLPVDDKATCFSPKECFKAGDVRVNQQPALISLQTIWMRHHNNVVKILKENDPTTSDEIIFQEARKIIGAQLQHITYKEFLPLILGSEMMSRFDLDPKPPGQYFTGYDPEIKPMIRNSFSAAAFRFGHSLIRDHLVEKTSTGSTVNHLFRDVFLKSDLVYGGGVNTVVKGLYTSEAYKTDRHMTHEVTRHLFERQPGTGTDLAAINIQRGRDHGINDYNMWKFICGLELSTDFNKLTLHSSAVRDLLQKVYDTVFDIDLFTGGVSEDHVTGGQVGPTFACLIASQFKALKGGDRFFYESNTDVKFPMDKLNEIKKTTMARIICDTTDATSIPRNVFRKISTRNRQVKCDSLPKPDYSLWNTCTPVHGQWSAWKPGKTRKQGCIKITIRKRECNNPAPNFCGKPCLGSAKDVKISGGTGIRRILDLRGNCRPGPIFDPPIRLPEPFPFPRPGPFPRLPEPFPRPGPDPFPGLPEPLRRVSKSKYSTLRKMA